GILGEDDRVELIDGQLDRAAERVLAEEGLGPEAAAWPAYQEGRSAGAYRPTARPGRPGRGGHGRRRAPRDNRGLSRARPRREPLDSAPPPSVHSARINNTDSLIGALKIDLTPLLVDLG